MQASNLFVLHFTIGSLANNAFAMFFQRPSKKLHGPLFSW